MTSLWRVNSANNSQIYSWGWVKSYLYVVWARKTEPKRSKRTPFSSQSTGIMFNKKVLSRLSYQIQPMKPKLMATTKHVTLANISLTRTLCCIVISTKKFTISLSLCSGNSSTGNELTVGESVTLLLTSLRMINWVMTHSYLKRQVKAGWSFWIVKLAISKTNLLTPAMILSRWEIKTSIYNREDVNHEVYPPHSISKDLFPEKLMMMRLASKNLSIIKTGILSPLRCSKRQKGYH